MIRTIVMAVAVAAVAALPAVPAQAGKKSPKPKIEEALKELEAQDRLDNFQVQSLSTAANVRSQAEKRLEQQRKDLVRNWGG